MKTRTTDQAKLPYPLTAAQIEQLRALDGRAPDTDDVPPAPAEHWAKAVRGKYSAAMQGAIWLRLDPDVLDWVGRKGPDYATEINRILRERMLSEQ